MATNFLFLDQNANRIIICDFQNGATPIGPRFRIHFRYWEQAPRGTCQEGDEIRPHNGIHLRQIKGNWRPRKSFNGRMKSRWNLDFVKNEVAAISWLVKRESLPFTQAFVFNINGNTTFPILWFICNFCFYLCLAINLLRVKRLWIKILKNRSILNAWHLLLGHHSLGSVTISTS